MEEIMEFQQFLLFNREVRISYCNLPFSSFLFESYSKFVEKNLRFICVIIHHCNLSFRGFPFECNSKYTSSRLGLDGYLEDLNGQELSPGQEFSVFECNGVTRIMLDPASFINHSCEPNVKFECGGATKLIVRVYPLRDIYAGEELLVKYSSSYFGPNNEVCYCAPCVSKRFSLHEVAANETVSPLNHPAFPNFQSNAVFHELQSVAPLDNAVFNDLHSDSSLGQPVFHEFQSVQPFDNPVPLDKQVIHEFQSTCDWNTATLEYPLETSETAETTSLNSTPTSLKSSSNVAQTEIPAPPVAQTEIPAPPVAPAAQRQEPAAQRQEPAEMKKKQKKAKYSDNNDCIICHHSVKRIDRHLLTVHGDFLTALDMQLIKDFYRFRECSGRVLMCYTCNRRFISKSTHEKRCSGQPKRLENHRNIT